jgi:hypothetical protein
MELHYLVVRPALLVLAGFDRGLAGAGLSSSSAVHLDDRRGRQGAGADFPGDGRVRYGRGQHRRLSVVRWSVAGEIGMAWVLTLPAAATVAALGYRRRLGLRPTSGSLAFVEAPEVTGAPSV